MRAAPVHMAGERLMLDPSGVLHWPARRLLCVADLHLEKGSSFAARGRLLPPYDTRETLSRLLPLLRRYRPERVVFLGDSFHDDDGAARLGEAERSALAHALSGVDAVWVAGNHDPSPPAGLPGAAVAELAEGPLVFRHVPQARAAGEVAGHLHPKAMAPTRVGGVVRPCFVADGRRLLLPAFGAFTGGLDVGEQAVASLFPRGARVFLLGAERLYSFPMAPRRFGAPAA
ncbi:ligase-associated DNA damage response endonuclease PdeM [Roseomonas sp. PWR1]|uniref:Ligase-associated DNA damage response endonuclease PdeM n=1 Tax=Roseomonas nitratireducens TaxID=2820810 RepID=A0ABS4ATI8_9PROT|nr:ligase-associated DNA damage response endonuclease PdeM [Neoroseomonas nitratireducens]MBP0464617.1 ligase-associated DNA damage response endonuclease PdeM [Neoroseomonas nitratireducens]